MHRLDSRGRCLVATDLLPTIVESDPDAMEGWEVQYARFLCVCVMRLCYLLVLVSGWTRRRTKVRKLSFVQGGEGRFAALFFFLKQARLRVLAV